MNLLDDVEDEIQLTINEEYARRHKHNKQREELGQLEEKYGKTIPTSALRQADQPAEASENEETSSSSSDEEADVLEELQDPAFLTALAQLRQRKGFPGGLTHEEHPQELEAHPERQKRKRERPVLLKDIPREMGSDSEDQQPLKQSYTREMEGIRKQLIEAAAEAEGDLFDEARPDPESRQSGAAPASELEDEVQARLDHFFGRDETLSQEDLFLKKFIANKGEAEGTSSHLLVAPLEGNDLDEDEQHLEAAEQFELKHNFRFEEPEGGKVRTYPRQVAGVVRQADTARAQARARKVQRKQEERAKMESEIQRLKTLKRKEIEERMGQVQSSSGLAAVSQKLQDFLSSDTFDEAEYEKAMQEAFDDAYYQEEDADFKALEERGSDDDVGEGTRAEGPPAGFQAVKQRLSAQSGTPDAGRDSRSVQKLLEEYNRLEYEDIVAGMPTKFHYQEVQEEDYGLSASDIFTLSDKDLNQLVGLKRYAPFKEGVMSKRAKRDTQHRLGHLRQAKPLKGEVEDAAQADTQRAKFNATNLSIEERRKLTYATPQLKDAKQSIGKQPKQASPVLSNLTKAQKKNWRRSQKRKGAFDSSA